MKDFDNYMKQLLDQNNVFHFEKTNENTVLAIINNLKNTNSSSFDNVSNKSVKFIKHLVAPLTLIINQSLDLEKLFISKY